MAVGPAFDHQISSPTLLGARLAAFAAGCLGTQSLAKAGSRLGLMGSADEEEFQQLLQHLERLARQRAAKLAGYTLTSSEDLDANAANVNRCSEAFAKAVADACGASIPEIYRDLPSDAQGRADMLLIFQMAGKPGLSGKQTLSNCTDNVSKDQDTISSQQNALADLPVDYVEKASALPTISLAALMASEARLLQPVTESLWTQDISAVNAFRGAFEQCLLKEVKPAILISISTRCGSKRPALAKAALRALLEVAENRAEEGVSSVWSSQEAAVAAHRGCLAAARGTKLMARFAEDVMTMASVRTAEEVGPKEAVIALMMALEEELQERSPQPAVFALALKVATAATAKLERDQESEATARTAALCKAVLDQRRLAPSYSQARACLRNLPAACQATAAAPATAQTPAASPTKTNASTGGAFGTSPTRASLSSSSPPPAGKRASLPAAASPTSPALSASGPAASPALTKVTASSLSPSHSPTKSASSKGATTNSSNSTSGGKATLTTLKGTAMPVAAADTTDAATTGTAAVATATTVAASSPVPSSTPLSSTQLLHAIASKSTSKASLSTTASTSTMATTGEISLEEVVVLVSKATSGKKEDEKEKEKAQKVPKKGPNNDTAFSAARC